MPDILHSLHLAAFLESKVETFQSVTIYEPAQWEFSKHVSQPQKSFRIFAQ